MKIEDHTIQPISFEDFADKHGLVMQVFERTDPSLARQYGRYFAYFKDVEIMHRGFLSGAAGDGATKELAIAAYAFGLRGKKIAVRALFSDRRDIQCPNEWSK